LLGVVADMRLLTGLVAGLSRLLDRAAGFLMVATMVLVVLNVLLRVLLKRPVFGAYEYVSLLTALTIGLALAHCGVQNGHIDISIVAERLPARLQAVAGAVVNIVTLCFWGVSAWYIGGYARSMMISGLVSPTTQMPTYPFVYLIAFGLLAYCLVLLIRSIESIIKAAFNR